MTTELPTPIAENLKARAERVAGVVKKPAEELIATARQVYADLIGQGKSTGEAENALDSIFAVDRKELNAARRAKLKAVMEEQHLSPNALVEKLNIPTEEKKNWAQYIYNIRTGNEQTGVTPERAEKLASVLGLQVMDLLIEYTDREKNRMNRTADADTQDTRMSNEPANSMPLNELKIRRGEALNLFMEQKQLSANQLAKEIEPDEYKASLLAMKIAESRQGEELLAADVLRKIADKFQVDAASLTIELLADERPLVPAVSRKTNDATKEGPDAATETPKTKRPYNRKGAPQQEEKVKTPDSSPAPASGEKELARITLSAAEFQQRIGFTLAIVQDEGGRYFIRMPEKKLTKDEVIQLLAGQIGK